MVQRINQKGVTIDPSFIALIEVILHPGELYGLALGSDAYKESPFTLSV